MEQFAVPIAFLVFNRPDTTAQVFEKIRQIRPQKLLLVADGPRDDSPGEAEKVARVRSIVELVDWPCEVLRNYSEINLGCKYRVSSGLNWVFEQVEEAIILEDDCLPHLSFFLFCKELLEKYRHDERVALISGDNFMFGRLRNPYSYYFSRYPHVWGWASWRRVWRLYDVNIPYWPKIESDGLLDTIYPNKRVSQFWGDIFSRTHKGEIDTWDFQLNFAILLNDCLCIVPEQNLVSNIGFAIDATHTKQSSKFSNITAGLIEFPLRHPPVVIRNATADELTENEQYSSVGFFKQIFNKISRVLHAM